MNSGRSDAREHISEIIGDCVFHALGLKEALRDERLALESQDADELQLAVSLKSEFIEKLSRLDRRRRALCESAGFPNGAGQMDHMTEWCDKNSVVRNSWSHLMEIVSECNAMNLTNGAIIRARQQMVEANLGVLRGADINPNTYQREGHDNVAMNQRSLAQA
ncbi:MAG: flagellar protein FlgN [Woeseiaceae bacterium]|nr:flagellar protein FlgN [Woeseiaceae bacterium]